MGKKVKLTTAYEIQEAAYAAFDVWLAAQSDEVQLLSLVEQIALYALEANRD